MTMTFEWDATKRLANSRKHGIDFADAVSVSARKALKHEELYYYEQIVD